MGGNLVLTERDKLNIQQDRLIPNTPYVAVRLGRGISLFQVYSPQAYIRKTKQDGKDCIYLGRTDSNGRIKIY